MSTFARFGAGLKEWFRKRIVSLKRRPENIALIVLLLAFLVYSLNLTAISSTTNYSGINHMGLCEFITFLLSLLSMVCFLNAFPKRRKPKLVMVILLYLMLAAMLASDAYYLKCVLERLQNTEAELINYDYIVKSKSIVIAHMIMVVISVISLATMPLYSKLLRKIDTSIEIEANENLHDIDVSADI